MYEQNCCPSIGSGFSQFKLTQRHKMASKVCALFSPKYLNKKITYYFQQNCCFIKRKLQPILLYTNSLTTMYIQTNQEQGQGHYKVKTHISLFNSRNSLFNSRNSTICIYLDLEMSAKRHFHTYEVNTMLVYIHIK